MVPGQNTCTPSWLCARLLVVSVSAVHAFLGSWLHRILDAGPCSGLLILAGCAGEDCRCLIVQLLVNFLCPTDMTLTDSTAQEPQNVVLLEAVLAVALNSQSTNRSGGQGRHV